MDQQMLQDLISGIREALSGNVIQIVLYGSMARGTNDPDSDIDIAVFVPEHIDLETEDRLSDVVVDLNLKYGKVFSVIDIEEPTYKKWRKVMPFYQNVDREGIVLWKAA